MFFIYKLITIALIKVISKKSRALFLIYSIYLEAKIIIIIIVKQNYYYSLLRVLNILYIKKSIIILNNSYLIVYLDTFYKVRFYT